MKTYNLTRKEAGKLQTDQTGLSERIAAESYNYRTALSSNFDAARESGAVMESKSTSTSLSSGRNGRFRLWKTQHEALLRKDREGTARYVFVLFDVSENPPVAIMKRKQPADIGALIRSHGGWSRSGHHQGKQKKLPWTALYNLK